MQLTAYDKLIRAKIQLMATRPFFSYLAMHMKLTEDTSGILKAMGGGCGVDMRGNLSYDKKWVEKLTCEQAEGVVVHETLHIALNHLQRLGGRDRHMWNVSNDMKCNDIIKSEGMQLPEGIIPSQDHTFTIPDDGYVVKDIDKKASEEIYEELYNHFKRQQKGQQGNNQGQGQKGGKGKGKGGSGSKQGKDKDNKDGSGELDKQRWDKHTYGDEGQGKGKDGSKQGKEGDGQPLTKEELQELADKWREVLANGVIYYKQRGLLPASMARLVDGLLDTKVDWKHKLYKYITNEIPSNFTWSMPSKKSLSTGIYMPSVVKEKIEIVVSIDTSGSINQTELTEFLSEICYIARSFANVEMDLLVGDSKLQNHYEIRNGNIDTIMNLKIGGGGGTSHCFVRDWIEENKPNCRLLIILSDGFSDLEQVLPELPDRCHKVIVLSQNGKNENDLEDYGEIIKLEG